MKLRNTTHWPDYFLRRMTAWVAKHIGLPMSEIKRAEFGKRSKGALNGRAWWSGRFRVVIGPPSAFPVEPYLYPGRTNEAYRSPRMADQLEALVAVTAHELEHLYVFAHKRTLPQIRALRRGSLSERSTRHEERRIHGLFVADRDALLAEWSAAPAERPAKPKASVQEKRAAKAQADLVRWQRKLKLAQTKIKKLKARVRYYDRVAAAP